MRKSPTSGLAPSVLRISFYVGDVNRAAFETHARMRTRLSLDWDIFDIFHEFAREAVRLGAIDVPSFSRVIVALSASQSLAADSRESAALSRRSKVERLITFSTSAVAVCCCSDRAAR